jgi:hypothetical protein
MERKPRLRQNEMVDASSDSPLIVDQYLVWAVAILFHQEPFIQIT